MHGRTAAIGSDRLTRNPSRWGIQHLLLLGVIASVPLGAQAPPRPPSAVSLGSRIVSPAVVATVVARAGPSGAGELDLLILWRGRPGWFLEAGRDGRTSTWGGTAGGLGGSKGILNHQVLFGGLTLSLQFEREGRTVRVQDIEVSLQDSNVILVDQVDDGEDMLVVGTRWIDPQNTGVPPRAERVIARSSELVTFLRCDASLSDPLMQRMVQVICDGLLNQ